MGREAPLPYMDIHPKMLLPEFAIQALSNPATEADVSSWQAPGLGSYEIIRLCERLSDQEAKIIPHARRLLHFVRPDSFNGDGISRLAFAEVCSCWYATASMEVYHLRHRSKPNCSHRVLPAYRLL